MEMRRARWGFPRWTLVLTVAAVLLIEALHQLAYHRSTLDPVLDWVYRSAMADSWRPMFKAYAAVHAPHSEPLYQVLFFQGQVKFQYPLTSLLPLQFADLLGIEPHRRWLNRVGFVCVLLQVLAVAQITYLAFRPRLSATLGRPALAGVWAAAALMALCFYPMLSAYRLGQVQTWINAWFSLACLAWMYGRPGWAGALIGLACLFKPQLALFLPWALLRRQWHFVAGWGAVALSGAALSIGFFGWRDNLDYFPVLSFMSRYGEAFYANQSVNGLLHRLLGNGNTLTWDEHVFPPYNAVVHVATLLSSALLIGAALLYRWREREASVVDLMIAGLSFTMASPIAWEHHYGVMAAAFPLLAALILEHGQAALRQRLLLLLVLSFLLCSLMWPSVRDLAFTWASFGQSQLLFGALIALGLLYRERDRAVRRLFVGKAVQRALGSEGAARPGSFA
ncbi:glycosyltransferase family 87 protein [Azohydromonas caseinilytica]|uniref:DUF2029 domain-containing protein n=1 Tax=Azohydromonas caseinilytica TaxID=2728836 RepID=A0A848FJD7_9BURK|nr:glycosyltransferase family 87 protein [Azohydromonas caseinilytica]NML18429.1 DUF2029 domain-containing protein [Azohydromonas caseinilytica]